MKEAKTNYMRTDKQDKAEDNFLVTQNEKFEAGDMFDHPGVSIGKPGEERVVEKILKGNQSLEMKAVCEEVGN